MITETYLLLAVVFAGATTGGVTTVQREFPTLSSCQEAASFFKESSHPMVSFNNYATCIKLENKKD